MRNIVVAFNNMNSQKGFHTLIIFFSVFIILSLFTLTVQIVSELQNSFVVIADILSLISVLINLIIITCISLISYIKYSKAFQSYTNFYNFSLELTQLNKVLHEKSTIRTKELEDCFEKETQALYTSAFVGNITQSLLHDISTPVSVLNGVFYIMRNNKVKNNEIILRAEESIAQLIRIIENGKELICRKDINVDFDYCELINKILFVLKDKLQRNQISVNLALIKNQTVYGPSVIFERIILNILLNAVEELAQSHKASRVIIISSKIVSTKLNIIIQDNGGGMTEEVIDKIFNKHFTLKAGSNLGLGLSFVKTNIEKYFKGNIKAESKIHKYSKFIISIPLYSL